jgi:uroporphyrinogen decarboxylase
MQEFQKRTGETDPDEYFGVEIRFVGTDLPPAKAAESKDAVRRRFEGYYDDLPEDAAITEWGTAHLRGSRYHFTRLLSPMRTFENISDFESFPLPSFDEPWRLDFAGDRIAKFHGNDLAVGGAMAVTIFEVAWQLRGMEELFLDFEIRPELATYLLDAITDVRRRMARFFADQDVDVLILGDDVSMQTGMLMSPDTWRKWFKGRMATIINDARAIKPEIPVFYHSDGNPTDIIEDLIEIGVTILNPVQPECISPNDVKRIYGEKLALWGTIGTQTTMPFGSPEDVRKEVRERIESVGANGGLVLGPTHSLEPDVPWENVEALYNAIEEYGSYE